MSCADTISMHHHHYVHCSVLNDHHRLNYAQKIVKRRGGLLVQLSQFYQFRIRGWWRWMEMLCYGDVDGDQTEPYPGLAAATKWPHFAHLTQMTSNKYKHFPENLLHLQHSWQTHVMICTMKRDGLGKSLQKKSKPFEWGLEWEAFWANLSEPGFSRRGFPWNIYPLYKYFYMSRNILDPLFDKSEDLRHLEESWCCQGGCQGIRGSPVPEHMICAAKLKWRF